MNISKRAMLRLSLLASLPVLASSCITIRDGSTCAAAGKLSAGGICSHLISPATEKLSLVEMIDLINAQGERLCVPVPGLEVCADDQTTGVAITLPARGAAIIMSAKDWGTMKTELETACREMGKYCSYAAKMALH